MTPAEAMTKSRDALDTTIVTLTLGLNRQQVAALVDRVFQLGFASGVNAGIAEAEQIAELAR